MIKSQSSNLVGNVPPARLLTIALLRSQAKVIGTMHAGLSSAPAQMPQAWNQAILTRFVNYSVAPALAPYGSQNRTS